jgi:peptidyl-prolyl cis-trans isomerase A (cyclophilin A)
MRSRAVLFSVSLVTSWSAFLVASNLRAEEADPNHGNFTLAEATKGIPGPATGPLQAIIETTKGKFTCELFDKQAPVTVANFVGLATGKRAWMDPKSGKWVQKKPFYDGLIFHRVIPGFMIQGGDPLGTGTGNPGYRFQDEIVPELKFDKPGQLAMANAGPATNGSQFFITDGAPGHLTGHHTIFGACEPATLVGEIARVKTGPRDKPLEDVAIKKVVINHGKAGRAKAKEDKGGDKAAAGDKAPDKAAEKPAKKSGKPTSEKPGADKAGAEKSEGGGAAP